jgi:hypothetical protein
VAQLIGQCGTDLQKPAVHRHSSTSPLSGPVRENRPSIIRR